MTRPVVPPDVETPSVEVDAVLTLAAYTDHKTQTWVNLPGCSTCLKMSIFKAQARVELMPRRAPAYYEQVVDLTARILTGITPCPFKHSQEVSDVNDRNGNPES